MYGQINANGRAALLGWLESTLKNELYINEWMDKLLGEIDGSFPDAMHVTLPAHKTLSGREERYQFGAGHYDLIEHE